MTKEEEVKVEKEEPAGKKIKIEHGEQGKKIEASTSTTKQKQVQKEDKPQPEIDKSTPGMSGLSIDFIRNAFAFSMYHKDGYDDYEFSDDYGEHKYAYQASDLVMKVEEIYHDRMANGRVRRLLLALVNIFRLCPRAKSDLQHEMQSNFPHHLTAPPILYSWYIHMCLQIVHIVPTFEGPTLTLFIDKALDMDVEMKVNDKGLVMLDSTPRNDGSGEDLPPHSGVKQELFKVQGEVSKSPMTPSLSKKRSFHQISNESLVDITPKSNKDLMLENESEQILEISERLDILMVALYQHIIKVTTFDSESLTSAITAVFNARRLYRHLDGVFDKKVRTTDRSKFVQFIFLVLFGRENDALEVVGRLMAKREDEQHEQQYQLQQERRQRSNSKDMVQTMKDIAMEPDMIPSAPINVTDPLYRGFSAKLIDLFYNPSYAGDVPRQTVVCYLASFVSRATYVCPETVCECLAALLRWAEVYIEAQPTAVLNASTPANANVRRISSSMSLGGTAKQSEVHALFYTACQAAFYIMCFRGAEALSSYRKACQHKDDPETPYADPDSVDNSASRWKFLCGHTLQPLKYCLESVRLEFLYLAENLDVFHETGDGTVNQDAKKEETKKFLETLRTTSSSKGKQLPKTSIATPKRRRSTIISTAATQEKKRLAGGVGGLGRGSNPLNSFFPFDPYLLQKSYTHVHPYYRNWEDCILTIEEETGENHEEEAVEYDKDAELDVSDLDDDNEEEVDEEDSDEEDIDEEEDSKQSTKPSPQLLEEPNLGMEIRRSRAMSTGSQASW